MLSIDHLSLVGSRRALLALWCIILISPSTSVTSQNGVNPPLAPSGNSNSVVVNQAGYTLNPSGLSTGEWPNLRLDFSVERSDHTPFRNLTLADVQPKIDGQILTTTEGDLRLRENQDSSVLLLLDGSGSMSGHGVDKLRAAKGALNTLIDSLDSGDRVELAAFDEEPRTIVPSTSDKQLLKKQVNGFSIRSSNSRFTRLYDAVDFGLREAERQNIKNVLVISDGWEDTPESRALTPAQFNDYKQHREQGITEYSRKNDIRVFTVAIGDEHGTGLSFVDRAALANISKGANGGAGAYIELTGRSSTQAIQQSFLLSRLQQTLDDMRKTFHYSYSLVLHVTEANQQNDREHKVWVGFTVGENPRIQLPVEYTLESRAGGPPVVTNVKLQSAIFIQSASRGVKWQQLVLIYIGMMCLLTLLAIMPAVSHRLARRGKAVISHAAISIVSRRSPLVGTACPNEGVTAGRRYLFKEGDVILTCPNQSCKTVHHLNCWHFNEDHCMNRSCELEMVVPLKTLEEYGLIGGELSRSV
jgi:Mg-chelatase subunit ChlD